MKGDSKLKFQTCAYQQEVLVKDRPVIESNGMPLEIIEKYFLGDGIGARVSAFNSVITRIKSGGSKFRDLVPLLVSKGCLPFWSKRQIIFCMCT